MSGQTMVFSTVSRRSEMWRVYRIRTVNSTYELEVQSPTASQVRRCVVLTCLEPKGRAGQTFEDSAPQVSGRDLFYLSPLEWMGKTLSVGTAQTSEIQSVDFIASADARRSSSLFSQRAQPGYQPHAARKPAPAPVAPQPPAQQYVEMAETAASLLRALLHRQDFAAEVRGQGQLEQRLKLAVTQCRLMLDALPHG
jgi:hypothetical protein